MVQLWGNRIPFWSENVTHTVCVCTLYQNIKLMMNGAHFEKIIIISNSYQYSFTVVYTVFCLTQIMYNIAWPKCQLNEIKKCPGIDS